MFSSSSTPSDTTSSDSTLAVPAIVQTRLNEAGINGDAVLHLQSDLDAHGKWGERHLIITPSRVIVLSVETAGAQNGAGQGGKVFARRKEKSSVPSQVTIDFDVSLDHVLAAEAKNLTGASSLELRVLTSSPRPEHGENGAGQVETPNLERETVIEVLRTSNAHAKEVSRAARQLEYLKEHGKIREESEIVAADIERKTCPKCGRALPPDSTVCPMCLNKWQALKRLITYLMPYKWMVLGNGVLSILGVGLSFVPPLALSQLVDHVLPSQTAKDQGFQFVAKPDNYRALGIWVLVILAASLGAMICNIVRGRWIATVGSAVLHDIRTQLYDHLQKLSLAFYDKRETGAVMTRVQNDVQMLQNFLLNAPEDIIISGLTLLGVIIVMMTRSPLLTLYVLIPVPFVVLGTHWYWRGLMKLWRRVWAQNSSLGARLADSLSGVRVVRAFAQETREVERFTFKSGEYRDAMTRVERKAASFYPVLAFVIGLGGPLTWYLGGKQVLGGALTLGGLTLFTVLLQRLYEPIGVLTRMINVLTRAMTAAERVFEILDTPSEVQEATRAIPMERVEGRVEFQNVTFGYEKHRPVLHDVDLKVEPGEMIGLVGHSGAGKSTLINLLMRFYDVDDGAILVDGVDLREIRRDDVRSQIGVVLQEPYLFHGTVGENIAYAKPSASPGEIMAAAQAAYAHDFIVSFPDGYDTLVGERGQRLSGGERQRISIARAILHNPRILILDEATASVDTQTEQQIQKALKNLVKGRTVFAIAHRLSTLRDADRLIVVEKGKIAETGTHDELIAKRGTFYKLVQAQQAMNEVLVVGG
jgi:ATP-binding cassette subfamily B protein